MSEAGAVTIVIPCFDEASRLDEVALLAFVDEDDGHGLVLVDDGSRDRTRERLEALAARRPGRIEVLAQDLNRGKAEAVRLGVLRAFAGGAARIGYFDADLSTPLAEVAAMARALDGEGVDLVFASRLKLLGRQIERRLLRHYLGRVYATLASMVLELAVYDSQCGAKLFRASAANRALFERPFLTRWLFDVEILARLIEQSRADPARHPERSVVELPVAVWREVAGSKVGVTDGILALRDLWRIRRGYALGRRGGQA